MHIQIYQTRRNNSVETILTLDQCFFALVSGKFYVRYGINEHFVVTRIITQTELKFLVHK